MYFLQGVQLHPQLYGTYASCKLLDSTVPNKNMTFSQFQQKNLKLWRTDFLVWILSNPSSFSLSKLYGLGHFCADISAHDFLEVAGLVGTAPALAQEAEVGRAGPAVRNLGVDIVDGSEIPNNHLGCIKPYK